LRIQLQNLKTEDEKGFSEVTERALSLSNGSIIFDEDETQSTHISLDQKKKQMTFLFGQLSAQEMRIRFPYLVQATLAKRSSEIFKNMNPFLNDRDIRLIHQLTANAMSLIVRIGLLNRCLFTLEQLITFMKNLRFSEMTNSQIEKIQPKSNEKEVSNLSMTSLDILQRSFATLLTTKRQFVRFYVNRTLRSDLSKQSQLFANENSDETNKYESDAAMIFEYDPRYLAFEFAEDIILRRPQIEMVDRFLVAKNDSRPLVTQMIMGSGKTTVVSPLLALMLAVGNELVLQVCSVDHSFFI
jgi:hypothetical protein